MKHLISRGALGLLTSALLLNTSSALGKSGLSLLGLKSKRIVKIQLDKSMAKKSKEEQKQALEEKARAVAVKEYAQASVKKMKKTPSYRGVQAKPAVFLKEVEQRVGGDRASRYVRSTRLKLVTNQAGLPTAEAEVDLNNEDLLRELSLIDRALISAGMPKIMFVVDEEYTGQDKQKQKIDPPSLRAILEGALLARGFTLVAKEQVEKVRADEAAIFKNLLEGKNDAAVKYAQGYGAEILVTATARVTHTSHNALGQGMHRGAGELLLRAYKTNSGEILHSEQKIKSNSAPNHLSETSLRTGMVKAMGEAIVESFVNGLLTRWDEEDTRGRRYTLSIFKLNYTRGKDFQSFLKRIQGISNVTQKTFAGGRLEVEVTYKGKTDLAQVILQASRGNGFKKLDVDSMRDQMINFKL